MVQTCTVIYTGYANIYKNIGAGKSKIIIARLLEIYI